MLIKIFKNKCFFCGKEFEYPSNLENISGDTCFTCASKTLAAAEKGHFENPPPNCRSFIILK